MTESEILNTYREQRQPVECWTRSMGYFRPLSYFNDAKTSEFYDRKWFIENKEKNNGK